MELAAILIISAFIIGFSLAWLREYREANLKKIEDNIRRNLLKDANDARDILKAHIVALEEKIEGLRTDLADIRKSTFEQISQLQKELKDATLNSIRHERDLSGEMARSEKLQDEIYELKEGEKPAGE